MSAETAAEQVASPKENGAILTNKQIRLARKAEKDAFRHQQQQHGQSPQAAQVQADATEAVQELAAKKRKHAATSQSDVAEEEVLKRRGEQQAGVEEEVQPLSHKEQRKRRRLEKMQGKSRVEEVEEGDRAVQDEEAGDRFEPRGSSERPRLTAVNELPPRSPHSIWIGNLSFRTSPQRIQEWLEQQEIQGISRVHMPKGIKRGEYNRGFVYIDLPSKEEVQKATELSELNLDGRRLLIKDGSDFTGRPAINADAAVLAARALTGNVFESPAQPQVGLSETQVEEALSGIVVEQGGSGGKTGLTKTAAKLLRSQKNPPVATLFFGNLPFDTTEENLEEMLEEAAKLRLGKFAEENNPNSRERRMRAREAKHEKKKLGAMEVDGDAEDDGSSSSEDESDEESSDEEQKEQVKVSEAEPNQSQGEPDKSSDEAESKGKRSGDAPEQKRARGAGIRQIRVGTFEDAPDKCKGWAFVDFHSMAHATATLIDYPRCYRLLGRTLNVQYASADAVRRGMSKGHRILNKISDDRQEREEKREEKQKKSNKSRPGKSARAQIKLEKAQAAAEAKAEEEMKQLAENAPAPGTFDVDAPLPKKHKETQEERKARREKERQEKEAKDRRSGVAPAPSARLKPGAALAAAQRASTSIVESAGKKTTFE